MNIWNYPVTFIYGYSDAYGPTFHTGEDRTAPVGTPVTVNGVQIGLSGNTGLSTGPHCHIGKWSGNTHSDPKGGGAKFNNAQVTEVHPNDTDNNGKYVRVQGDGYSWVYLHLSEISVAVGDILNKKENDVPNEGDVDNVYLEFNGRVATPDEKNVYTHKDWSAGDGLYYGKALPEIRNLKKALEDAQNKPPEGFVPVGELYVKK